METIKLKNGYEWDPGDDPYKAQDAARNHRKEIEPSEVCGCISCQEIFPPSEIKKWWSEGKDACCPHCGLTCVVIGSASGLPIDKYYLGMAGGHLVD